VQRTTRPTVNQPNRTTSAQASRTISSQSRAASPQVNKSTFSQTGVQSTPANHVNSVTCRKCKSQQIVANKRGYSFANMFKTLGWMALLPLILLLVGGVGTFLFLSHVKIGGSGGSGIDGGVIDGLIAFIGIICWISISLSLPVSILVGFAGRSELVNGCMNCGFKWRPAKKK